ncbi:MAG: type II glyceraldehyde-3-phosphate dehydrogenase [Euryarchaeota archaeon]|nr:type II glyceraldehyde-3-phosphate dehydrogenase [Euryarchaeota archaeon]
MKVRVGINGYGTIGKRVASAVAAQDDMEVIGVTKTRPSYEAYLASASGFPLYTASSEQVANFEKEGIEIKGTLDDLMDVVDIMIDATPGGVGEAYLPRYQKAGIKAIFQGGERHELAGVSFNAYANYSDAWGADFARVVSCNTTGLVRTLFPLDRDIGIERVSATLVRRGADPSDNKGSALNNLEPSLKLPTHHGPDVKTIIPGINITTMAVKSPTTLMHLHCIMADLEKEVKEEDILATWEAVPRVKFVSGKQGMKGTANIMEMAKDLERQRGDLMEVAVWQDGIKMVGKTLYYYQAVHQESDVVPENIDCIRSMMEIECDPARSIKITDNSLGINE